MFQNMTTLMRILLMGIVLDGSPVHAAIPLIVGPACDPARQSCVPTPAPPGGPGQCGPGPGGATCAVPGPAAQGSGPGINVGAGNPINVITGNKYQREVDMPALPGVLGLEIVRHYNSVFSSPTHSNGSVGRGWKLSYETDLYVVERTIQIVQADGTRIIFNRDPQDPSLCASTNPADGTVRVDQTGRGDEYTWTWTNGRQLNFTHQGKLVQILAPTGEFVSMQHDRTGMLLSVRDPQNRQLHLNYLGSAQARASDRFRGVQEIDSPVGRFTYEYGSVLPKGATLDKIYLSANLVKVGLAGATNKRIYHYEDAQHPTLLTGISVEGVDAKPTRQRIATYAYDINGKGILTVKGDPARLQTGPDGKTLRPAALVVGTGIEQVTLDTSVGGRTVVSNSVGQKTIYRHAIVGGQFRLLEVRGAGCASCGESNVRYDYDSLGRLSGTTRLNALGQPIQSTRTERDAYGRTGKVSQVSYRNGKPGVTQRLIRYEYTGTTPQPVLVARPSVVPGREAVTRITYNDRGQPLTVSESGWVPALDGRLAGAGAIERNTAYHYRIINNRSMLTGIDGPLPNGKTNSPLDSDITQINYDKLGNYAVEIIGPGNQIAAVVRRDDAGRPLTVTHNDGARLMQTQLAYAPQGQLQEVMQTGRLINDAAHPQQERDEPGRKFAAQYDAMGQLTALQLPASSREIISLLVAGKPEPAAIEIASFDSGKTNALAPAENLQYRTGEPGSATERIVQELFHSTDGDQRPTLLARRWLDDFGRLVAVQHAGQGVSRASYSGGSDQLATLTDATGVITQLTYDIRGQVETLRRTTGDGKLAERIEYQYSGSWLVEQTTYTGSTPDKADSKISTRHNAFGQVTQEVEHNGPFAHAVNHVYDEAGRLVQTWITQGSGTNRAIDLPSVSLHYHGEARLGERIDAIQAGDGWFGKHSVIGALQWLLPAVSSPVPANPHAGQVHATAPPVAIAWRYGNGLQARSQYDPVTKPGAPFGWRLRSFHDGVHAYAISSDAGGHINAVSQGPAQATAASKAWQILPQAHAGAVATLTAPTMAGQGNAPVPPHGAGADMDTEAHRSDAAGRRLSYQSRQGELTLIWDSAGHLAQVRQGKNEIATYRYDAQGRRISKTVSGNPGASRQFIYDGQQLIAEADGNGLVLKQFIDVGWRVVAWIEPAQSLVQRLRQYLFGPKIVYLHTDHRGAVTAATDGSQAILWQADMDANGNARNGGHEHGIEQPLRLAGQYADQETGLHYNLARYYDPRSGHFLSPDPAGLDAGSLDLYAYANGDALNFFDPDGWAKVTYYAITAKADGSTTLGTSQGFTNARWAFVISDIKGGVKENVVYDPTGSFVKKDFATAKGDAFAWNKNEESYVSNPVLLMQQYYGNNLVSLSQFTIDNFDDEQARAILQKLGYSDTTPICAAGILPQIQFSAGEAAIDVTQANANGAGKQRILNCQANNLSILPISYADVAERERVERMEAAAEINETSSLNKDCSISGCPGINIQGQVPASGQLPKQYYASYGRSQFVAATFIETLDKISEQDKKALGITPDIAQRITAAKLRAAAVVRQNSDDPGWFKWARSNYTCEEAVVAWDNAGQPNMLTLNERANFQSELLLGHWITHILAAFRPLEEDYCINNKVKIFEKSLVNLQNFRFTLAFYASTL